MSAYVFAKTDVQVDTLQAELRKVLGDAFDGLAFNGERVTVVTHVDLSAAQEAAVERVIRRHDPAAVAYRKFELPDRPPVHRRIVQRYKEIRKWP